MAFDHRDGWLLQLLQSTTPTHQKQTETAEERISYLNIKENDQHIKSPINYTTNRLSYLSSRFREPRAAPGKLLGRMKRRCPQKSIHEIFSA